MKPVKKLFQMMLTVACLVAALLLVVAAYSHWVSPLRAVAFSYLGLFFPFILAFNALLFVVLLISKQWKQGIVIGIAFLLSGGSIYTYFPLHSSSKEVPEDCIKVLTYNVMRFEYLKPHDREHTNDIIRYIVDADADIICLQEYGIHTEKKNKLGLADLKKALGATPYHHIEHVRFPYEGETYGLAIFSKYPIVRTEKLPYSSEYNGSFLAELDINGRRVTVVNNHLESNRLSAEERVGYDNLTREPNMTELSSFTKSMYRRLTPAFKTRARQAQLVAKTVEDASTDYVIVCGDFNDTPISYARHKIKGELRDAFVDSGRGMGITYNKYRFLFRIDYILHSANMKSYNTTVGSLRNSDHYPVCTYLQFVD